MSTKVEKPLEASPLTHVADMPPLEVVTEGIPPQEHIGPPPVAQPEAPPAAPEHRRSWFAWALAGVIGLLLVVAGIFAVTQYSSPSTSDLHMGLTPQAWQEYRAGERASTTPFHLGLTLPAWLAYRAGERASEQVYSGPLSGSALPYTPYWSIPSIASMTPMSIASIEPITSMSIPSIEPMSIASIEPITSMSIPTIEPITPISIPATPTTPTTPPNESIQPVEPISIPSMSIPTIEPISFPSFPTIEPISIPPFPDM
jgi:hypothetical protein